MYEDIILKPCPFCGSKDAPEILTLADVNCRDIDEPEYENEIDIYAVVCSVSKKGCGCSTGQMPETPEEAAELWNRRTETVEEWTATLEKVDNLFGLFQMFITCPVCKNRRYASCDTKRYPKYCDNCGTKLVHDAE